MRTLWNGVAWAFVVSAAATIGASATARQPAERGPDEDPILVDGVALFESPMSYQVRLKFEAPGRLPVEVLFEQPTRTRDGKDLLEVRRGSTKPYGQELRDLDAYYRRWGFEPLKDGEKIQPTGLARPYELVENAPTFRQICGGFALGPMLGERLRVPTDKMLDLVQGIGTRTEDPRAWDIVVFYRNADGLRNSVSHYALVESVSAASLIPGVNNSRLGKVILTKNQEERAYRGSLADYVSPLFKSDPSLPEDHPQREQPAPASRVFNSTDFVFYRVPWGEVSVTRFGGPFADDRPLLKGSTTSLRVQVVNALTYELVPNSEVTLRFRGSTDPLKTYEVPTGVLDLSSVPGSSGRYEAVAKARGFKRGTLAFKLDAGIPTNVIVALKAGADEDDVAAGSEVRGAWGVSVGLSPDKPVANGGDLVFQGERISLFPSCGFKFLDTQDFYSAYQTPRDKKFDPFVGPTLVRLKVLGRTYYDSGLATGRNISAVLPPGRHPALFEGIDLSGKVLASARHTIVCGYKLPDSKPDQHRARAQEAIAKKNGAGAVLAWLEAARSHACRHEYDHARAALMAASEVMTTLPASGDLASNIRGARREVAEREGDLPTILAMLAEAEGSGQKVSADRARWMLTLSGDWKGSGVEWRKQFPQTTWPFAWPE